jgi:hypothetical protein
MTEEPKSFTVKDRRHFTPDGQAREPEDGEAHEGGGPPSPGSPVAEAPAEKDRKPTAGAGPSGETVDFGQFLMSLAAQAGLVLSGQMEPQAPGEALAEARSMIGVLEMLQDKTEGNRTPRENDVLDGLLYELRMAYVARAREMGE